MLKNRMSLAVLISLVALSVSAPQAQALDRYSFGLGLQGVIGGTSSGSPDAGLDNYGFQAVFSWQTNVRTYVMVRAGQLALDVDETGLFDQDLSWLTVAGEYRFADAGWDSGLFVGLGAYDQSGASLLEDDTAMGLTVGTTARFGVIDRLDVLIELGGHFTDLDQAQTFFVGTAGLMYRF